jgi:hypothetical protein
MLEGSEGNIEKEKRPNVERGDILVFDMTTKEIQLFDTRGTLKETIGTFPDFSDEDFHRFAADTAYEARTHFKTFRNVNRAQAI